MLILIGKMDGKFMKKIVMFLSLILGCLCFVVGCGNEIKNVEGTLEDVMAKLYEGIAEENLPMGLTNMEVNAENIEGFLGTSDIEYKEAVASESMVGSIAHSVVLVRANDANDVQDIEKAIKENVNPRKWICVGVEEENVIIDSKGDLVILILIDNEATRTAIDNNFKGL